MWLAFAFLSAALLGLYDAAKKKALMNNAVLPVLWLNTLFSALLFLPFIISARCGVGLFADTVFDLPAGNAQAHGLVAIKSAKVMASWVFG